MRIRGAGAWTFLLAGVPACANCGGRETTPAFDDAGLDAGGGSDVGVRLDATSGIDARTTLDAAGEDATLDASAHDAQDAGEEANDGSPDAPSCTGDASSPYIDDAIDVVTGADDVCVLRANHRVECWGMTIASPGPFPSDAGSVTPVKVSVGDEAACVLDSDSHVWCWGKNEFGQLGFGPDPGLHPDPVMVLDATAAPLAADDLVVTLTQACVIQHGTRAVLCWGEADDDELGIPDAAGSARFGIPTPTANGVTASASARFAETRFEFGACLIDAAGATCWGDNASAQFARPSGRVSGTISAIPAAVASEGGTTPLLDLSISEDHGLALDSQRRVYCWGWNGLGECGSLAPPTPPSMPNPTPVLVPDFDAGITAVGSGFYFSCVLDEENHVRCFGEQDEGFLGNGNGKDGSVATPQWVVGPDGGGMLGPVVRLSVGGDHSCAIVQTPCSPPGQGQLWCWGFNGAGNLNAPEAGTVVGIPIRPLAQ
jgi:alpha-tubulin suppressor-like RCC1 family protein